MKPNVRRYVLLPKDRGGMCFCRLSRPTHSFSFLLTIVTGKNHDTMVGAHRAAVAAWPAKVNKPLFLYEIVLLASRQLHIPTCYKPLIYFIIDRNSSSLIILIFDPDELKASIFLSFDGPAP